MLEKIITRIIMNRMRENGFFVFKAAGGMYQQPGISDIIACGPDGRFVAIEVKQPNIEKTLTRLQQEFLIKVIYHNGIGLVVTSWADMVQQYVKFGGKFTGTIAYKSYTGLSGVRGKNKMIRRLLDLLPEGSVALACYLTACLVGLML